MKKTILTCLVLMAIGLCLFVSCNGEQSLPENTDGVAYVRFGENVNRDFTPSYKPVPYSELYWYYTAEKTDGYGTFGQKTTQTAVKTGDTKTGIVLTEDEALGPFSEGSWNFTLYAYKENSTSSTLIYKSEAIAVKLTAGETKAVSIATSVTPVGETGTVKLEGAYFNYASQQTNTTATYPNFQMVVTETSGTEAQKMSYTYTNVAGDSNKKLTLSDKADITSDTSNSYTQWTVKFDSDQTLPEGTYKCVVTAYISDIEKPIGKSEFWFAVYPNATTTISGSLTEKPDTKVIFAVKERVIQTAVVSEDKATFEQTLDTSSDDSSLLSGTNVTLDLSDLNANKQDSEKIKSVTLETETLIGEEAAEGFSVVDKSNATESVLVSLDFTAKDQNGNVIGTDGFGESKTATITKFVGKNKNNGKCYNCNDSHTNTTTYSHSDSSTNNLAVYYNGVEDTNSYKITKYNAETGYAEFTTTHFSTFVLVDKTNFPAYIETSGSKTYYPTLEEAFDVANKADGATTIVVNRSTYLQKDVTVSAENITLDFKGSDNASKTVGSRNGAAIKVDTEKKLVVTNSAAEQADIIKGARVDGISNIDGTYYASFDEAYEAVEANDTVTLVKDVEVVDLSKPIDINKNFTVDLGGNTLIVKNAKTVSTRDNATAFNIMKNTEVTVKNGKIVGYNGTTFCLKETGAKLTLDNVNAKLTNDIDNHPVWWEANDNTAITPKVVQLYQCVKTSLTVKNSKLYVEYGAYGIASNALSADAEITVNIENSTVECNKGSDSPALMLNVPGNITITGSTIIGDSHGAILRGGTHTISNSTFEFKTASEEYKAFESKNWSSGNGVPNAAIVIGNRSDSYNYPTTVTFNGTNTLTVPEGSNQLYVYQKDNTDSRKVTVTGADSSWTVNENRNGATYTTAE